ncbi:ABC transporter permease [Cryptosporangium minutisporangium]|uniref:Transport permease protein n=1 Tax=Cryptosporangium minutisporangium TaxID=113569 RepID=A0ABP6SRR5_9ACTN
MTAYSALTKAAYRGSTRDATTVFFTFAFPLIFLVVFGLIFQGQQVEDTSVNYITYIAPGVLSWGLANAALFTVAFTLMQWRNDDLLRLIRMTPAPLWSVLASRFVVAQFIGVLQAVLFVGVAMLPFLGMSLDPRWPLALPILVLAIATFLALGLIVGARTKTPEAVAAVANCVIVPMAFLSGSFFPLHLMPGFLQVISKVLPLRYVNDGMSYALAGRGTLADYGIACAALAGFTIVFGAIGMRMFRWSNQP